MNRWNNSRSREETSGKWIVANVSSGMSTDDGGLIFNY